jgi:hypothetical protein
MLHRRNRADMRETTARWTGRRAGGRVRRRGGARRRLRAT